MKKYRTFIRIEHVGVEYIKVVIPSWNPRIEVPIRFDSLPEEFREELLPLGMPYRCHAMVNIGAEDKLDLEFTDWEWGDDQGACTVIKKTELQELREENERLRELLDFRKMKVFQRARQVETLLEELKAKLPDEARLLDRFYKECLKTVHIATERLRQYEAE